MPAPRIERLLSRITIALGGAVAACQSTDELPLGDVPSAVAAPPSTASDAGPSDAPTDAGAEASTDGAADASDGASIEAQLCAGASDSPCIMSERCRAVCYAPATDVTFSRYCDGGAPPTTCTETITTPPLPCAGADDPLLAEYVDAVGPMNPIGFHPVGTVMQTTVDGGAACCYGAFVCFQGRPIVVAGTLRMAPRVARSDWAARS